MLKILLELLRAILVQSKSVSAAQALAAAGDYAANDVLSDNATDGAGTAWYFQGCARSPGRSFMITGIRARITEDSVTFRPEIHFFRRRPVGSELDDNAAFNLAAVDNMGSALGSYSLPAFTDLGGETVSSDDDIRKQITPDSNDTGVWAIVKTLDAEANETASMRLEIELEVVQY